MRYSDKIGREIRSVREAKGYSQEYVAEMLGTSQSTYANLESGKSTLSVDRLLSITQILEIDVQHLLNQSTEDNALKTSDNTKIQNDHSSFDPKILHIYDQLIAEQRNEIVFLRELIKQQFDKR